MPATPYRHPQPDLSSSSSSGAVGRAFHDDRSSWSGRESGTSNNLTAVTGNSGSDVPAVGGETVLPDASPLLTRQGRREESSDLFRISAKNFGDSQRTEKAKLRANCLLL